MNNLPITSELLMSEENKRAMREINWERKKSLIKENSKLRMLFSTNGAP